MEKWSDRMDVIAGAIRANHDVARRCLTYREWEIMKLRCGFGDGYSYTLEDVGKIFKVTRERVRHVQTKAIAKLVKAGVIPSAEYAI